ncbi:MAG: sigma 54-interacting transcriptional regulator [Deltaproteobacteria bacterium]|nr:sigma 54-interacting transcriptional regulator [Deltaproteobacteria bacterium]
MRSQSEYSAERLLESFFRISNLITTPLGFDDILQKILDEVVETVGFHRGIILLLDEERENLVTKVVKNYTPVESKRAFSVNLNLNRHQCLETLVAKTGQYLALEDSATDPRITETDRKITNFYKRGSTFYAPLRIEDEIVGIISLWSKERSQFSPEQVNILLTFANQVSVVIQIAKLFEENSDKIKKLLVLQEAASQLNAIYDLDRMHELTINSALKIGNADHALMYFLDVEKNNSLISDGEKVYTDKKNECFLKIQSSIVQKSLETQKTIIQDHAQRFGLPPLFEGFPVEIAIPFKIKEKFKGVLYLSKRYGIYTSDQRNFLDILAINAATSYDSAIMHSLLSREAKSLKSEIAVLKEREYKLLGFHNIIGSSQKMLEIFRIIEEVAGHNTSILVQGESGTGKELIARAIHRQSNRKSKRFVDVNCAAIPGTLLESELFGYEAGAFTDARKRKFGLIEHASGGTMLLDEIGEMSLSVQAKFLRMIEDGYIRRLGGTENIPTDVRFIFSTNRDLSQMVSKGTFREDLFYRISVVPINIPPLRERDEDIIILAYHYIEEFNNKFNKHVKGFSSKAETILRQYPWPGNVRELKNIVERVMIMQNVKSVITPEDFPAEIKKTAPQELDLTLVDTLELDKTRLVDYKSLTDQLIGNIKGRVLRKALEINRGNKTAAARQLGISRYTLIRELKKVEDYDDSTFDFLPPH